MVYIGWKRRPKLWLRYILNPFAFYRFEDHELWVIVVFGLFVVLR